MVVQHYDPITTFWFQTRLSRSSLDFQLRTVRSHALATYCGGCYAMPGATDAVSSCARPMPRVIADGTVLDSAIRAIVHVVMYPMAASCTNSYCSSSSSCQYLLHILNAAQAASSTHLWHFNHYLCSSPTGICSSGGCSGVPCMSQGAPTHMPAQEKRKRESDAVH